MKTLDVLMDAIRMRPRKAREVHPMRPVFSRGRRRAAMASLLILAGTTVISRTMKGQFPSSSNQTFIPNGTSFLNPGGDSQTYSAVGGGIDQTGPFFQSLGT